MSAIAPYMEQLEPTELLRRVQERTAERAALRSDLLELAREGCSPHLLLAVQAIILRLERLEDA